MAKDRPNNLFALAVKTKGVFTLLFGHLVKRNIPNNDHKIQKTSFEKIAKKSRNGRAAKEVRSNRARGCFMAHFKNLKFL
ncbi:hypothetical protein KKG61_02945 [bacterium]|nr:hypothetical protein [bacterium]MBU1599053.1 hypothetical protein [bacterium]